MKRVSIFLLLLCSFSNAKVLLVPSQYTTISSAIDSASVNDTVLVATGVYLESLSISKSITVIGSGTLQTMIRSGQTRTPGVVISTPIITISSAAVILKNLLISSYQWDALYYGTDPSEVGTGVYGTNATITIDGCKIQRMTNFYVDIYSSNFQLLNSTLTDEHMLYSSDVACRVTSSQYLIRGNTMGYKIDHCISIESGSSGVVENNMLYGSDIYWGQGVRLNADGIVRNNTITGRHTAATAPYFATASGVSVSSTWITMAEIYGNTISGFQNGISLLFGHNSVSGNVIFNNVTSGIYVSRGTYDNAQTDLGGGIYNSTGGNEIYGNGQYAIKNDCPNIMLYAKNNNFHTSDTNQIKLEISDPAHVIISGSVIQSPSAPTATSAGTITQTGFIANWNSVNNASGYYLDVASDSLFLSLVSGYSNKDAGNVTSYTVNTSISAGTKYYYRLRAYNSGGTSSSSNIISLTTLQNIPVAPVAVSASAITQSSFIANWNPVNYASGYYIDVASDSLFTGLITGYNNKDAGNVTSYTVNTNVSAGTKYYYRVRAYNSGGLSGNSNFISLITLPDIPIAPVAVTTSAITQISFTANWNSVSNSSGYYLDVASDTLFTNMVNGFNNKSVGNVNSYTIINNLLPDTKYYYRVRSYNEASVSGNSNIITLNTLPNIPDAPVAIEASSIAQTAFKANWNAVSNAGGYYLDVAADTGFKISINEFSQKDVGKVTSFIINSNLLEHHRYYYRIRAYNSAGISGSSNVISLLTLPDIPGVPNAAHATAINDSGFTANWDSVKEADGYRMDIASDSSFTNMLEGYNNLDAGNTNSYTVRDITLKLKYYYRVRAYNTAGTGNNSATITVEVISGVSGLNSHTVTEFKLYQNYPNPFNPSTIISWQIAKSGNVILKIYDILGNEVATLINEYQSAGRHSIVFNTEGKSPTRKFASGIYFYRIIIAGQIISKKMLMIK